MSNIEPGIYRARAIEGSEQYGVAKTGTEQVSVDLELVEIGAVVTAILAFSDAATPYSLDRLRALGWEGGDTFAGISKNEVNVQIAYEEYEGKTRIKAEIQASRFSFAKPMDDAQKRAFFARITGGSAPKPAANAGSYPANWDEKPAQAQRGGRQAMKL